MRGSWTLALALGWLLHTSQAAPAQGSARNNSIVIWHGLGDNFDGEGLKEMAAHLAKKRNAFVHIISIKDEASADRKATFFGSAADEVDYAYQQINEIPQLKDGYDAIGFSQGASLLAHTDEKLKDPQADSY